MASVLLVEDDLDSRDLLERLLAFWGHTVTTAVNGREALTSIQQRVPEVVITDLMMPLMDGVELLREIRACSTCNTLPVFVLSGGDTSLLEQARDYGVADVFRKAGYDARQLMDAIDRVTKPRT